MEIVVVERLFEDAPSEETLHALGEKGCDDLYRVTLLRTYVSPDRRRIVCVYEAPDAEAVRQVNRTRGVPFERVWTCSVHEP